VISTNIIQYRREQDVTMSLWNNWLYRRLLFFMAPHNWSLGVLDFCAGRDKPRQLGIGAMSCYILFGEGKHEQGTTDFTPFEAGSILKLDPDQFHTFACDKPARLLVVASETPLDFNLSVQRLGPGRSISGEAASYYILHGCVDVRVGCNNQKLESTTAFFIMPQIEYTVENIGNSDALIIGINAGVAVKRGINGASFAQK